MNDAFTQVLEWARGRGMVKLGRVAIDSTRIAANASRDRVDSEQALRDTRAQVRAWQKAADRDDAEPGGLDMAIGELNQALGELPRRLERLKRSGLKKLSRSDEDARFLRQRGDKFVLGYTAEISVSDDHLIVAQRVTQNATDNASLEPWWMRWNDVAARRRARLWPTAGFSRSTISTAWNSATSMPMYRTPTWRAP